MLRTWELVVVLQQVFLQLINIRFVPKRVGIYFRQRSRRRRRQDKRRHKQLDWNFRLALWERKKDSQFTFMRPWKHKFIKRQHIQCQFTRFCEWNKPGCRCRVCTTHTAFNEQNVFLIQSADNTQHHTKNNRHTGREDIFRRSGFDFGILEHLRIRRRRQLNYSISLNLGQLLKLLTEDFRFIIIQQTKCCRQFSD